MDDTTTHKLDEAAKKCACFNFRMISRLITQKFNAVTIPCGLQITQFGVLASICMCEGIAITRLSEKLVMDRTTLTRNIRPLEKNGYIKIGTGKDQRVKILNITAKGKDLVQAICPKWKATQLNIINKFGEERWEKLLHELGDLMTILVEES